MSRAGRLLLWTGGALAALAIMGDVSSGDGEAGVDGEAARIAAVTRPTTDFSKPEAYELNPAGAATSPGPMNRSAFSRPSANMDFERQLDFRVGDGIFRKLWVSAPSSTRSSDGLGPLYNARSCQSCHRKDGRGHPPTGDDQAGGSMVMRLSIPPTDDLERAALASLRRATLPDPRYGSQLQVLSIQGHLAEGRIRIDYEEIGVELEGGETVRLRKPSYEIADLNYGPLHPGIMMSPRVAPPMIGLGLLEQIDQAAILARADADDADGDGISGRPNRVWSEEHGEPVLGRFGWKASEPTLRQQTAHAFAADIGLSSDLAPYPSGDCTEAQDACLRARDGGDGDGEAEVPRSMLDLVVFYARNLAVPARRDLDAPQVLAGKKLFYESGCTACHAPKYVTRRDASSPEQSFQLIWPYSDLLLHDMGEGLADHRPDGDAGGREWRTPPLWGIGLTETVSGHTFFLHDGRARDLLEAILWHGGEAEPAKERVAGMTRDERDALIAFLKSL